MTLSIGVVPPNSEYDLVIACCGYESRSRGMVESLPIVAKRRVALGYLEHHELAFSENSRIFSEAGFEFFGVGDNDFACVMDKVLAEFPEDSVPAILVDISCFTRVRLAYIVEALARRRAYDLDVYYSLAEFSNPSAIEPANEYLCPVSSYFSGWTGDADRAVGLICGLGYEQLKALGIIEYIDPFETWLFFPDSSITQYDAAVVGANKLVLGEVFASNIIHYPVIDGVTLLRHLLSLVGAAREEYRCIVMPLGPKVFAFASLLVASVFRDVSVWRASSGRFAQPRDRRASTDHTSFRVSWRQKAVRDNF